MSNLFIIYFCLLLLFAVANRRVVAVECRKNVKCVAMKKKAYSLPKYNPRSINVISRQYKITNYHVIYRRIILLFSIKIRNTITVIILKYFV